MSTMRQALAALAVAAVLGPSPAQAQAVRGGSRGAVTAHLSQREPSGAERVRSVPVATPRTHRPYDRSGRIHARTRTVFVPYVTTYAATSGAATTAELQEAVDAAREAALEAREAALDAREAALDARDESTGFVSNAATPRSAGGSKVLTWKPGGITPVEPDEAGSRGRVVRVDGGAEPAIRPASDEVAAPLPATRVRLELPLLPLLPTPLWWEAGLCSTTPIQLHRQQRTQDRRRFPWGLGWLNRYGKDVEVERGTVAPPSFYMRSPLLSGLYRRPDCDDPAADTCAEVSLVGDDDAAIAFDVPLPQLDAKTPESLRAEIRERLSDGETVVLRTTDGEAFDLMPGAVREIGAGICRTD